MVYILAYAWYCDYEDIYIDGINIDFFKKHFHYGIGFAYMIGFLRSQGMNIEVANNILNFKDYGFDLTINNIYDKNNVDNMVIK